MHYWHPIATKPIRSYCNNQKNSHSGHFGHKRKCVYVVYPILLSVTLNNQPSLIFFYRPISFILDFIDPLAFNKVFQIGNLVRDQVLLLSTACNLDFISATQHSWCTTWWYVLGSMSEELKRTKCLCVGDNHE